MDHSEWVEDLNLKFQERRAELADAYGFPHYLAKFLEEHVADLPEFRLALLASIAATIPSFIERSAFIAFAKIGKVIHGEVVALKKNRPAGMSNWRRCGR